jgi:hypothetical protein
MLSNFSAEPYRRQAARLGAHDFFDKTNEFERVRDVVARRAVQRSTEGSAPCQPSSH